MRVTVKITDDKRDDRFTGAEFDRIPEFGALHRPHQRLPSDDRGKIRLCIADEIRDNETITARRKTFLRNASLDLKDPGLRLLQKHDRSGLARVDDVKKPIAVEVERHDGVHLVGNRNFDPFEPPVGGDLVHRAGGIHRIIRRCVGLLHMQFEAALEVVGRDEVRLAVAIEIARGDRPCVRINLDNLEAVEPEV